MAWRKIVTLKIDLLSEYCAQNGERLYFEELLGLDFKYTHIMYIDNTIYRKEGEIQQIENIILERPKTIVPLIFNVIKRQSNLLVKFAEKLYKIDFKSKSNRELRILFQKYILEYSKVLALINLPLPIEGVLTRLVEKELEKKINPRWKFKEFQKYLLILVNPDKEINTIKEKKNLLRIASIIKRNNKLVELFQKEPSVIEKRLPEIDKRLFRDLNNHVNSYCWMGMRFLLESSYNWREYIERIKGALDLDPEQKLIEINREQKTEKQDFRKAVKELKFSKRALELIKLLKEDMWIRAFRLDAINKSNYYAKPLFKEIAARMKFSYEDIVYLMPEEIEAFLETGQKRDIRIINERKENFAIILENDLVRIDTGDALKKLKVEKKEVKEVKEIRGTCASSGIAAGFVKIVKDKSEINKVVKGDILVTEMTTPDFARVIERAGAVVTDLGGLTSHAAIISREFGIPCVVGTKIATKVLKDWDEVEVDATAGIVRKIKGNEKHSSL